MEVACRSQKIESRRGLQWFRFFSAVVTHPLLNIPIDTVVSCGHLPCQWTTTRNNNDICYGKKTKVLQTNRTFWEKTASLSMHEFSTVISSVRTHRLSTSPLMCLRPPNPNPSLLCCLAWPKGGRCNSIMQREINSYT